MFYSIWKVRKPVIHYLVLAFKIRYDSGKQKLFRELCRSFGWMEASTYLWYWKLLVKKPHSDIPERDDVMTVRFPVHVWEMGWSLSPPLIWSSQPWDLVRAGVVVLHVTADRVDLGQLSCSRLHIYMCNWPPLRGCLSSSPLQSY